MKHQLEIVPHPHGGYALHFVGDPADRLIGHFPTRTNARRVASRNALIADEPTANGTSISCLLMAITGGALAAACITILFLS